MVVDAAGRATLMSQPSLCNERGERGGKTQLIGDDRAAGRRAAFAM
jgi:hypothetical protein